MTIQTSISTKQTLLSVMSIALALFCAIHNIPPTCAQALGDQTSKQPLFAMSDVHCDDMVILHRWEGSCCSLNVTAGNGCILNVMDGWCKVYGQEWTLNFNSTYNQKPCPASAYSPEMLGMKTIPKDDDEESGSFVVAPFAATLVVGLLGAVLAL